MEKRKNPIIIFGCIFGVLCVILIVVAIVSNSLKKGEFGDTLKIDNFDSYEKNTPEDLKESIFATLYNTVKINLNNEQKIVKSGAKIRDNSYTTQLDAKTYTSSFIVDIEKLQQSYKVFYSWSNDEKQNNLNGGYQVQIGCVEEFNRIYSEFACKENENQENAFVKKYPIAAILPIKIDSFSDNYSKHKKYTISYEYIDEKFSILINDYTGGNYNDALERITSRGYKIEDYSIKYIDNSEDESWGKAF